MVVIYNGERVKGRPPHGGRGLKFRAYLNGEFLRRVALPTEGVD